MAREISGDQLHDLLLEVGTEELPPRALSNLADSLAEGLCEGLNKAKLNYGEVRRYATPRRLAVLIRDVPEIQPDRRLERRGPTLSSAFKESKPTKAAEGFARSCGVSVDDLQVLETDKGSWLTHISIEPGTSTVELVPPIVATALSHLPIPKRMRWADREDEFVRPVHWVVLLLGDTIIPATILGLTSGRMTCGHRFHHPQPLYIASPSAYAPLLETEGKVIADLTDRREAIRAQAEAAAVEVNGRAVIDPELLDEVTALVEWPVAILGGFESRFLKIPPEVLITTMQDNQKYFPVVDAGGRLMPYFITISNIESRNPAQVRAGNERVIRPRFSDAEFFWNQDRNAPLISHLPTLRDVVFQQQLGSLHDKSARVARLARFIAGRTGASPEWAERAAWLAKCDLLTHMVQEFPELQGTMGRYYAQHDGEPEEVAWAQEEQYRPRFAGDVLPTTAIGQVLALADRLDTLIGIFAIGEPPSGAKDPFALRRAGLGVLRILIECELNLDLEQLLEHAAGGFESTKIKGETVIGSVFDFIMERLRAYYAEHGLRHDEIEAVLACRPTCPLDFDRRIRAVAEFRKLPEAESLTTANKRIHNILRQIQGTIPFQVHFDLLVENAEQILAKHLTECASTVIPLMETGLYTEALIRLAELREPVDNFFDQVLVMTEDAALRNNRIALLNELGSLFSRVADFSRLQT